MSYKLWQQYPDHIGCIVSPGKSGPKTGKFKHPLPYVLDNGAFPLWQQGREFDAKAKGNFTKLLEFYAVYDRK